MALYAVRSIIILDSDCKRICCKYYSGDYPTKQQQLQYESNLFRKTARANSEVVLFENQITVYKSSMDVYFYVTGAASENEIILLSVLNTLMDSLSLLLRNQVEKRTLLDNLEILLLVLDELIDDGIILEADPSVIATRVSMRSGDGEVPLAEQTISQALQTAKEQIARSLLKG